MTESTSWTLPLQVIAKIIGEIFVYGIPAVVTWGLAVWGIKTAVRVLDRWEQRR